MSTPPPDAPDEELAGRAADGCRESFEQLIRRYEGRILGFLMRKMGNLHDAQDVAQTTFVAVHRGLPRYDRGRPFAPWLYTIAVRQAISHARARRDHLPLPEELAAPAGPAPGAAAAAEDVWQQARARLPEAQFTALRLRYAEGLSVAESAQAMRKTIVHVKVLLHRARGTLARTLRKEPV